MPERDPTERAHSFDEVNLGYTTQLAVLEAERCLQCPRPKCVDGCPVGIRIDRFITHLAEGEIGEAAAILADDTSLPAVCGRVCPQENQCEGACVLARKERPIAIGNLERFVADYVRDHDPVTDLERPPGAAPSAGTAPTAPSGHSVAVVGSGPAGLACAFDLIRLGHAVTVYEALHELGGVLVYGIPEYRLPKHIVKAEIDRLRSLGVEFITNAPIGLAETIDDLLEDHDAVFLGVGAGLPRFLDVPGEHLIGVYSANEFLTRVNLMRAYRPDAHTPVYDLTDRRVAVIGGGNTAMDAVRTSLRLGAAEARILYRRTSDEMPARHEEVRHAREEGVTFEFLRAPVEFHGDSESDDDGWLRAMTVVSMELGEPDDDGRRRPHPIPGSEQREEVDVVIVAVGNQPNPLLRQTTPDLAHTRWGTLEVDPETGATSRPGVFAGGDIVTGGATVILAMGAGRKAATAIHRYLSEYRSGGNDRDQSKG
jgi:glutamate synthase (NADPH/NADH) small chain